MGSREEAYELGVLAAGGRRGDVSLGEGDGDVGDLKAESTRLHEAAPLAGCRGVLTAGSFSPCGEVGIPESRARSSRHASDKFVARNRKRR